jgi:hypothetical protein
MKVSSADIRNMTDGLVPAVAKKANLSEDQSRQAVLAAFEYLKENLPPSVASDVDTFVKGGGDVDTAIEWFLGLIGRK